METYPILGSCEVGDDHKVINFSNGVDFTYSYCLECGNCLDFIQNKISNITTDEKIKLEKLYIELLKEVIV